MIEHLTLPGRRHIFRRSTSCSISLSSDRSATSFFSPLHLRRHQPTKLATPIIVGRLADPSLPANLLDRHAFFTLTQDEGDLLPAEPRLLHEKSSAPTRVAKLESSSQFRLKQRGAGQYISQPKMTAIMNKPG